METRATFKRSTWSIIASILLVITIAAFVLSEVFKYNDFVLYSSVLILILMMLIAPGFLALIFPEEWVDRSQPLRAVLFVFTYPIFFVLVRSFGWMTVHLVERLF